MLNHCSVCGGVTSLNQPETSMRVSLGPFRICTCKREQEARNAVRVVEEKPAQKHDGKLGQGDSVSYDRYHRRPVHVKLFVGSDDIVMVPDMGEIAISPQKALSLRDWLIQESPELERLAKEQSNE